MVMRSGAGLVRKIVYGIFAACELFWLRAALFCCLLAELAACKALAIYYWDAQQHRTPQRRTAGNENYG